MTQYRYPVVICANGGRGDHLLNLPALRAVECLFPGQVTMISMPRLKTSVYSGLRPKAVYEIELEGRDVTFSGSDLDLHADVEIAANDIVERVGPCDLLINFTWWRSAEMSKLVRMLAPQYSIGFYDDTYDTVLHRDKHVVDILFSAPLALDPTLRVETFAALVFSPEFDRRAADLRALVPKGMHALAVHADTKSNKMWSADQFRMVLDGFLERYPQFMVFIVGREDLGLEQGRFSERIVPCLNLPLTIALALMGKVDLFLGIDSCMLHAADMAGVPGAALFGPTDPAKWGFRFAPHRHLVGRGKVMHNIAAQDVIDALCALWEEDGLDRAGEARVDRSLQPSASP